MTRSGHTAGRSCCWRKCEVSGRMFPGGCVDPPHFLVTLQAVKPRTRPPEGSTHPQTGRCLPCTNHCSAAAGLHQQDTAPALPAPRVCEKQQQKQLQRKPTDVVHLLKRKRYHSINPSRRGHAAPSISICAHFHSFIHTPSYTHRPRQRGYNQRGLVRTPLTGPLMQCIHPGNSC